MQEELASHLRACADAFSEATSLGLTTIAQKAHGDWRFFSRLDEPGSSFTIRKYDEVMRWFSDNWPAGTAWPKGVKRPAQREAAA